MRSEAQAVDDAMYHSAQLIDALQDADAPEDIISRAESLQQDIQPPELE
jgi:hypothetical protein